MLKAPAILGYNDWLGRISYRSFDNTTTYDSKSYEMIDEIFEYINKISPVSDNGARELFITAERGQLEDFEDPEKAIEEGDYDSIEDLERCWHDFFPTEKIWYCLQAAEDTEIGYKTIYIDHRQVIEVDSRKERSPFDHDISEYVEWILESVKSCYEEIKAGTYNDRINRELPPEYRTGTITRKEYYDIFPEERDEFLKDITKEEIDEFISTVSSLPDYKDMPRIQSFTANEFYKCCALGYKENNYEFTDLSPKEQYYKHADGRDSNLKNVDGDSVEAFINWCHDHENGHPWEVCRGGNSTHIDLYAHHDSRGFFLGVQGAARTRCVEAVKFFLAIHRAGYPVYIYNAKELVDRFNETEKIGVVPKGVTPRYCSLWFPKETIISFMNLPYEKTDEVAAHCVWQPLEEVKLLEE
ncbi:hypothetical protein SAMN02910317_03071 [Ruminococcaceae bacterium FB2012]|nr:hypothetical protein SAMN02910317_03071 [Ruminococcaceae bacterium FB2012]